MPQAPKKKPVRAARRAGAVASAPPAADDASVDEILAEWRALSVADRPLWVADLAELAVSDFAPAYPDEFGPLLLALGLQASDPALEGRRVVDVLADRFALLDPIEDDAAAFKRSEPHKWIASLIAWRRYRDEGEDAACENLVFLLELDCAFFLRQRWVAEMIAGWRTAEAEEKVHRLLFGSGKAGVPAHDLARPRHEDQLRICGAVYQYAQREGSLNRAFVKVGVEEGISPEAVRDLYRRRMERGEFILIKSLAWNPPRNPHRRAPRARRRAPTRSPRKTDTPRTST